MLMTLPFEVRKRFVKSELVFQEQTMLLRSDLERATGVGLLAVPKKKAYE